MAEPTPDSLPPDSQLHFDGSQRPALGVELLRSSEHVAVELAVRTASHATPAHVSLDGAVTDPKSRCQVSDLLTSLIGRNQLVDLAGSEPTLAGSDDDTTFPAGLLPQHSQQLTERDPSGVGKYRD